MAARTPSLFLVTQSLPYLFGVLPIPHLRPRQGGHEGSRSVAGEREFNFGGGDATHSEKQTVAVGTLLWLPYKIFQRRRCGGRMSFAFRWRRRGREGGG